MIVPTKDLFQLAYKKYAIGAYNINNLEQTMGLFQGCIDSQSPFIIQISKGARSYTHKTMLEGLIRAASRCSPTRFSPSTSITAMSRPATTALIPAFTPA
jgi:fructose-bisphosphate aldolase, class II